MAAITQPLSGWFNVDVTGQKAQGGIVISSVICNEVANLITDLILPKYRQQRLLEFLCIVAVGRLKREQDGLEFEITI